MTKERFIEIHKKYGIREIVSSGLWDDLSQEMDMENIDDEIVDIKAKMGADILGITNRLHKSENIGRYENGKLFVDTCKVWDSEEPYETAIKHPDYNNGQIIIVDTYLDKESAQIGHKEWIKTITSDNPPDELIDVSKCTLAKMINKLGDPMIYKRRTK